MAKSPGGHIEQLPSGSYRVVVYAGWDPATRRRQYLRATVKDETQAKIELGRLLKEAQDGHMPDSGVTVAKLLEEYAAIAEWDLSTRQTNEGFHPPHDQAGAGAPAHSSTTKAQRFPSLRLSQSLHRCNSGHAH